MKELSFTWWKNDEWYLGYLNDYPDYSTQGKSKAELIENLTDLFRDLDSNTVPYTRKTETVLITE